MSHRDSSTHCPAVILGANEMALAAARDLSRRGVPVLVVHFGSGKPPAAYSRHLRFLNGPDLADAGAVLDFLAALAKDSPGKPVLLPTQDQTLLLIHRHRDVLARSYRFYVWDSELVPKLGSKVGLAELAARYELPVPRTIAPRARTDVEQLTASIRFPCLIKPEFTNSWWTDAACELGLNEKAIEVKDLDELLDVYDRSQRVGSRIVIQEKVVGPDSNHMSYITLVSPRGELSGEMIASKLRVYPPRFGVAAYAEATTTDDAMRVGRGILMRLGFRGFASVQLKRDERDGQLYLIEVNLRLPLAIALAISAGLSFPYYYYQTCLGQEPDVQPLQVGRRWMSAGRDLRSMQTYARDGTWTWRQWVADWCRRPVFAVFRADDPLPAVSAFLRWAWSALGRRAFSAKRRVDLRVKRAV